MPVYRGVTDTCSISRYHPLIRRDSQRTDCLGFRLGCLAAIRMMNRLVRQHLFRGGLTMRSISIAASSIAILIGIYIFGTIHGSESAASSPQETSNQERAQNDADVDPMEAELLTIAKEYREWGPVDTMASWAPLLCRRPMASDLHQVELRASKSDDDETHGRKIYLLYARDRAAYKKAPNQTQEIGQAIVKQAWRPAEHPESERNEEGYARLVAHLEKIGFPSSHTMTIDGKETEMPIAPYVDRGEKIYRPDELDSLFIMFKMKDEDEDEHSDNGWIYGTVSADGQTVTSSGRLDNCMGCHIDAGDDRLFGIPDIFGGLGTIDD